MAGDGLAVLSQDDFSAGAFQGVARHLIPPNGLYAARNALLDDDGSAYKRGGSEMLSTANFNANGLRFLFDGYVAAGRRTVFADQADFGVLDGAEAPVNLGGAGLTLPKRAVVIGGVLIIGGGTIYAGSRKTANYVTATITTTQDSKVITGAGTAWLANVDAGMLLQVAAERFYVVASVDNDTQITLTEAYEGTTGAGKAYVLSPLGTLPAALQADYYAVAGDRLVVARGRNVTFSNGRSPGGTGKPVAGQLRWQTFADTDRWEIPDGGDIVGAAGLRDIVFVFSTAGVYAISNMAYDLTDAVGNLQQRLDRVAPDLVLWGSAGIANWQQALIFPSTDGVWLIDGQTTRKLSTSIEGRYLDHVKAGRIPGIPVIFQSHLLLPILSAAGATVDMLVCRLDRRMDTRIGEISPWTWMDGSGANVAALAVRQGNQPKLLGAGNQTSARVLNLSTFFAPGPGSETDHDDTNFEFDVTTRDFIPDRLNVEALIRQVRARYELEDAAAASPAISAWYSLGAAAGPPSGATWGSGTWGTSVWGEADEAEEIQLSGTAPVDDGRKPYPWTVNKRGRLIRIRLRSSKPASKLVLRNLQLLTRPSGRT